MHWIPRFQTDSVFLPGWRESGLSGNGVEPEWYVDDDGNVIEVGTGRVLQPGGMVEKNGTFVPAGSLDLPSGTTPETRKPYEFSYTGTFFREAAGEGKGVIMTGRKGLAALADNPMFVKVGLGLLALVAIGYAGRLLK